MAANEGPSVTSEIAERMGVSMTNASNLRRRLIDRGVIKDLQGGASWRQRPIAEFGVARRAGRRIVRGGASCGVAHRGASAQSRSFSISAKKRR